MIRAFILIIIWANLKINASAALSDFDYSDASDDNFVKVEIQEISKVVSNESRATNRKFLKQLTHDNRGDFVFEHNLIRSSADPVATNMVYMVWSLELEKLARFDVSDCSFQDKVDPKADEFKQLNMWFSSSGLNSWNGNANEVLNVSAVVETWADEGRYFDFKNLGCELGRKCMRYAQLVWATASHVGCAVKYCEVYTDQAANKLKDQHYVICLYGEGETKVDGNGDYKMPYKSRKLGRPCSDCPTGFTGCRYGLCDTSPQCETVVDCANVAISELCLCEESVYGRGQRWIVPLSTSLRAVVISVIFVSSFRYDIN